MESNELNEILVAMAGSERSAKDCEAFLDVCLNAHGLLDVKEQVERLQRQNKTLESQLQTKIENEDKAYYAKCAIDDYLLELYRLLDDKARDKALKAAAKNTPESQQHVLFSAEKEMKELVDGDKVTTTVRSERRERRKATARRK